MNIIVWIAILFLYAAVFWDQLVFLRQINSLERRLEEVEEAIQLLMPDVN